MTVNLLDKGAVRSEYPNIPTEVTTAGVTSGGYLYFFQGNNLVSLTMNSKERESKRLKTKVGTGTNFFVVPAASFTFFLNSSAPIFISSAIYFTDFLSTFITGRLCSYLGS